MAIAIGFLCVFAAWASQEPQGQNFPIAELQYRDGVRPVYLHSPYGFVTRWENGKGSYYVYDAGRTNIFFADDFAAFVGALSRIQDGSEVSWVNTCSAPLYYGMPPKKLSKIQETLKRKRFKMAGVEENNFPVCTCEATNLVFFDRALPISKFRGNKLQQP